jgi:hypothetical protein
LAACLLGVHHGTHDAHRVEGPCRLVYAPYGVTE